MNVEVKVAKSFKKQAKRFLKKYPSLDGELVQLGKELLQHPQLGIPIGHNAYKIRIAVRSKSKGKSGGMRVITYLETEIIGLIVTEKNKQIVNLISIYDKSEIENITQKELKELITNIEE